MSNLLTGKPIEKKIATIIAMILSVIHILNIWMTFPSHFMRGIHLAFILVLIYLGTSFDRSKKAACVINIVNSSLVPQAARITQFTTKILQCV